MDDILQLKDRFISAQTGLAPASRIRYDSTLKVFVAYMESGAAFDVDILPKFDQWAMTRYSRQTRNGMIATLKRFLEWLDANDLLTFNRAKALARLSAVRGRERAAPYKKRPADPRLPEMLGYFERQIEGPHRAERDRMEALRNYALIHTFLSTAARLAEVLSLTRSLVGDGLVLEANITGKGDYDRILFFSPACRHAIQQYTAARHDTLDALWVAYHAGIDDPTPMAKITCYQLVKRAASELGLQANTSPHSFRHWVASDMANRAGVPGFVIQEFLGHKHFATTRTVYIDEDLRRLRRFTNQYHAGQQCGPVQLDFWNSRNGNGHVAPQDMFAKTGI
ncbi:MAG: tyrosine-type recombinase/integrase [Chloroflexi bacterium]|nr:tyrosine-type recombinase/integrase [Chloroflexota bacterium]